MKEPETKICPIMSAHRNIDCVQEECEFWVEREVQDHRGSAYFHIEGKCSIPIIALAVENT